MQHARIARSALFIALVVLALPGASADPGPLPEEVPDPQQNDVMRFVQAVRQWADDGSAVGEPAGECIDAAIDSSSYPYWEPISSGEEQIEGGTRYWVRLFSMVYSITQYDDCDVGGTEPQSFPWP